MTYASGLEQNMDSELQLRQKRRSDSELLQDLMATIRVKLVNHGEDVRVKAVDSGEDLRVVVVKSGETLRVRLVNSGEQKRVKIVKY